jgi:hypothetical protein
MDRRFADTPVRSPEVKRVFPLAVEAKEEKADV